MACKFLSPTYSAFAHPMLPHHLWGATLMPVKHMVITQTWLLSLHIMAWNQAPFVLSKAWYHCATPWNLPQDALRSLCGVTVPNLLLHLISLTLPQRSCLPCHLSHRTTYSMPGAAPAYCESLSFPRSSTCTSCVTHPVLGCWVPLAELCPVCSEHISEPWPWASFKNFRHKDWVRTIW